MRDLQITHGTPKTKTLRNLIETDDRIVGYSIEDDGVFIYTNSSEWCDDAGSGTFRGDNETGAVKAFKNRILPADYNI